MANGTLKVQNIETSSGSGTITLGQSGETIALGSGVTSKMNHPAFKAYLSSDQTGVTSGAETKVTFQSETFDTDGYYDNSTNYRFTPLVAGKYYVNSQAYISSTGGASNLYVTRMLIKKNGSDAVFKQTDFSSNPINNNGHSITGIVDMNGSTDYLEIFARGDTGSGTVTFIAGEEDTFF